MSSKQNPKPESVDALSADKLQSKIPWEPYKGATNKINTLNNELQIKSTEFKTSATQMNVINKDHLIRYKVDTNLDAFNSNRPGYQFDNVDLNLIEEKNCMLTRKQSKEIITKSMTNQTILAQGLNEDASIDDKLPPNFLDARFYTDVHFLKLANQLKKKCLEPNSFSHSSQPNSTTSKPVNVVGPLIEKKNTSHEQDQLVNSSSSLANNPQSHSSPYGADNNSIKFWKAQQQQYESQIDYLKDQIRGINEQLQIQTQVNVELKKLLVASIGGEDMQYKLERLINDKQRYEFELVSNAKLIDKLTEDIEQISIQTDLWRSKFLAQKLMNEDNATWKSFLLLLTLQNETVLKNIIQDNELLNDKLNQVLEVLVDYNESKSNKSSSAAPSTNFRIKKSSNNLQAVNLIIANLGKLDAKLKQATSNNTNGYIKPRTIHTKTINEMLAEKMLEQFDWLKTATQVDSNLKNDSSQALSNSIANGNIYDSLDRLEKIISRIKMNKMSSFTRLYQAVDTAESDLFLNVCTKCKGQVKIV